MRYAHIYTCHELPIVHWRVECDTELVVVDRGEETPEGCLPLDSAQHRGTAMTGG
jgi:hypothetical protein